MMGMNPGGKNWPEPTPSEYRRLVGLARRRLVGHEHHAEDVVSRAFIKWSGLPDRQRRNGRIEQVIKTEAYSLLRSENSGHSREHRVGNDPSHRHYDVVGGGRAVELHEFRQAIAETCRHLGIELTTADVEFIELLLAGLNLTETQKTLRASRYEIRKLQHKWRRILRQMTVADMVV